MEITSQLSKTFVGKTLFVVGFIMAAVFFAVLAWLIKDILVLLFAGILLGVLLTGISGWIRHHTPLSHRQSLGVVLLLILLILGIGGIVAAPSLVEQSQQIGSNLEQSTESVQSTLSDQAWAQPFLARLPDLEEAASFVAGIPSQMTGVFSRTFSVLVNITIILFVGVFLALEPDVYSNGFMRLFPRSYRHRAGEVLDEAAYKLRWWLIGRLASMAIVGVLSIVGLMILGISLAVFLGVLAGLLAFIPFIGPVLAVIPPALIAFTISPTQALYVLLLYAGIQMVESYLITPFIQRRAVDLPPVVLILSQTIFGFFFNLIGVAVAAPFAAMMITLGKMLYVEDVLGDDVDLLKEDPDSHFAAGEPAPQ